MPQISVQDLMVRRVATVLEDASLEEAIAAILKSHSTQVYVVTRGHVLRGVIPEYELLKARVCGISLSESVQTVVSKSVQTLSPTTVVESLVGLFRDGFRSAMPVVDSRGRLIGQITRREVLWVVTTLERLEHSAETHCDQQPTPPQSDQESQRGHSVGAPNFLRRSRVRDKTERT